MPSDDTIASEALAAAVGGAISSGVLYPLEVLKTRMQAEDSNGVDTVDDNTVKDGNNCESDNGDAKDTSNALDYAQKLLRSEGIGVFFDGMEVSAIQSAIEKAMYFFAYTALKRGYSYRKDPRNSSQQISALSNVFLGCLAEWVHLPITLPIDALTTAIQTSGNKLTKSNGTDDRTNTVLAIWMTLWKEKCFYKGIQAYWILCFKPALQYTIFEQVKSWILRARSLRKRNGNSEKELKKLSAGDAFLLGMIARTLATLVVFPFVRAKVRMQSDARSPSLPTESIWKFLVKSYTQGGWKTLYQGIGPELTRGVLSAALMMMVKERISSGVKSVLYHRSSSSPPSSLKH